MDQRWVHKRDRLNKGMFCTRYACSRYKCSARGLSAWAVGAKERT